MAQQEALATVLVGNADLSVERFLDFFIAALVIEGKTSFMIKIRQPDREREGMIRLYGHFVAAARDERDPEQRLFLGKLRDLLEPGLICAFSRFRNALNGKAGTILQHDDWRPYMITLTLPSAASLLSEASERMRALVTDAARVYVGS